MVIGQDTSVYECVQISACKFNRFKHINKIYNCGMICFIHYDMDKHHLLHQALYMYQNNKKLTSVVRQKGASVKYLF